MGWRNIGAIQLGKWSFNAMHLQYLNKHLFFIKINEYKFNKKGNKRLNMI